MPMPQRVQYSETIEPLVQFVEDTPPSEILDRTLDKLRAGIPTQTMLMASALAVTRSTEMPPGHHGGPLHPLAGLYAVSNTVERLEGEQRFVPVLQHVALTNKHINHPAMGPYALPQFAPEDAGGVEATKAAFLMAVGRGEWNKADHLYQWLWDHAPRIEAFDLRKRRRHRIVRGNRRAGHKSHHRPHHSLEELLVEDSLLKGAPYGAREHEIMVVMEVLRDRHAQQ